jgi:hypothetical protein
MGEPERKKQKQRWTELIKSARRAAEIRARERERERKRRDRGHLVSS